MANKLTRNPWVIDTASATYLRTQLQTLGGAPAYTQGTPNSGPIRILAIMFSGYTSGNTDQAIFKDEDGTVFLTLNGITDKAAVGIVFARRFSIQNLAVTTLTSGIVSIFLEN
jgi:hypothetical protein